MKKEKEILLILRDLIMEHKYMCLILKYYCPNRVGKEFLITSGLMEEWERRGHTAYMNGWAWETSKGMSSIYYAMEKYNTIEAVLKERHNVEPTKNY